MLLVRAVSPSSSRFPDDTSFRRAERRLAMATAIKKGHGAAPVARSRRDVSGSTSLEFLVYQDNGGDYHWEIVGEGGERLAQSRSFASHEDAERAARCVHDCAGSARLEPRAGNERQLVAG
jgi:uncharacterized protein YegP (UPF0339 family)